MRWFKHMTDMAYDPKIQNIQKWYGFEGVGRWCRILEIVASNTKQSNKPEVVLDELIWKDRLGFYRLKELHIFLRSMVDVGLIYLQCTSNVPPLSGQSISILIPNLLKIRDNKKNKAAYIEEEVDIEEEVRVKSVVSLIPNQPSLNKYPQLKAHQEAKAFWDLYPGKKRVGDDMKILELWESKKYTPDEVTHIFKAVEISSDSEDWTKEKGKFMPRPLDFLVKEKWKDVEVPRTVKIVKLGD